MNARRILAGAAALTLAVAIGVVVARDGSDGVPLDDGRHAVRIAALDVERGVIEVDLDEDDDHEVVELDIADDVEVNVVDLSGDADADLDTIALSDLPDYFEAISDPGGSGRSRLPFSIVLRDGEVVLIEEQYLP